jgi:hypothetical protein
MPSAAQVAPSAPRPVLHAVRVEEGPAIDGRLDNEVWSRAPVGGPLYDSDKRPGQPMIERTEFRVLYDQHNLYIGVWCFDSNPEGIVGRVMQHEGNVSDDDYFYVMLDTFHDRRNGYLFLVNPVGGRMESLVTENIVVNRDWDGIWQAKLRGGWAATAWASWMLSWASTMAWASGTRSSAGFRAKSSSSRA